MDNNIKAIDKSLVLTRRCLSLFYGNAALKMQLKDKILKFEQIRNQLLYACLAAAPQPLAVVPLSSTFDLVPPPSHTVAAAQSATATATTGTASASTNISAATIQTPQKYPQIY